MPFLYAARMELNISNSSLNCSSAYTVISAPGFGYLLVSEIVIGSLAALTNAPLVIMVWRITVFHFNLRLLLSHLSFALLWYSTGYVIKALILLKSILFEIDHRHLIMDSQLCKYREIPYTIPISMTVYVLLFINVERLVSTLLYRIYDKNRYLSYWGILWVAICWICPLAQIMSNWPKLPNTRMNGVCENLLSMSEWSAIRIFFTNMSILAAATVCCIVGYMWNKYKLQQSRVNRAQHTLASRFQIDQNVKVNRVMMPFMFVVTLCFVPNYVYLLIVIAGMDLNYETRTLLIHVNYLWKLIYALAHPLISYKRNTYLRQRMSKVKPFVQKSLVQNAHPSEHQVHFDILAKTWQADVSKTVAINDVKVETWKISKFWHISNNERTRDTDVTTLSITSKF